MKLEVGLRAALRAFIGPVTYCPASPSTLSGPCCTCLPIAREFLTPCPFHRSKPTSLMLLPRSRRPSFRSATLHQRESRHRRRPSAAAKPQSRRSLSRKEAARQQISRRHAAERPPSRSRKAAALRGGPRPSARRPLRRPRRRRAERGQRGRTPKAVGPRRGAKRDGAAGGSGQRLEGTGQGRKKRKGLRFVCVCVRGCVRACVLARAHVCVYVCARARALRHASCVS